MRLAAVREEVPNRRGQWKILLHSCSARQWMLSAATFSRAKNNIICYFLGWLVSAYSGEFLNVCLEAVAV